MWFFKKKKRKDRRFTGDYRWNIIKETDTHILQRRQSEIVDMESGEILWEDSCGYGYDDVIEQLIDKRTTFFNNKKPEPPKPIYLVEGEIPERPEK